MPTPGVYGATVQLLIYLSRRARVDFGHAAAFARRAKTFMDESLIDIHCHLLPGIDDGASDWSEALAMARMAAEDGTGTIIATPHQLGSWCANRGETIRSLVAELNQRLDAEAIAVKVLAGGEIRIEPNLVDGILNGELLTLGDHHRHVLLELPHELYFPLDGVIAQLAQREIAVVLAHPERNAGLYAQPELISFLVDAGVFMQITAGSLTGSMGPHVQSLAEWMLAEGLVHLVATDAHSPRMRRPLMSRAFERICELAGPATARELCSENPGRIAAGVDIAAGRIKPQSRKRWWSRRATA